MLVIIRFDKGWCAAMPNRAVAATSLLINPATELMIRHVVLDIWTWATGIVIYIRQDKVFLPANYLTMRGG